MTKTTTAKKPAARKTPQVAPLKGMAPLGAVRIGANTIVSVQSAKGGDNTVISYGPKNAAGFHSTEIVPNSRFTGAAQKLAVKGGDIKAVREALKAAQPVGVLAKGLDAHNAPHSAKAREDAAKAAKKATPAKSAKAAKTAERKAKAAPKGDDTRKITIVDKKFTFGGEGTARRSSWDACAKAKTVVEYAKAGGALKYLPRWVAAGAIKLA